VSARLATRMHDDKAQVIRRCFCEKDAQCATKQAPAMKRSCFSGLDPPGPVSFAAAVGELTAAENTAGICDRDAAQAALSFI
jgi:hypothetical protein